MSSYLKPRRGKKATAEAQLTSSTPLKRGEVFFEVPDTGTGTGIGKIKIGDGSTGYSALPYFLEQLDPDTAKVAFTDTNVPSEYPYSANPTLATAIAPTASLKTIFTSLKQLVVNYNTQLESLNADRITHATERYSTDTGGNAGPITDPTLVAYVTPTTGVKITNMYANANGELYVNTATPNASVDLIVGRYQQ